MTEYTINTDAVSSTIDARNADAACRGFAAYQGWKDIFDIRDLAEKVEGMDGWLVVTRDGVPAPLYSSAIGRVRF